jgi:hypothetical protein
MFLRRQIAQRFPVALEHVSERLELWYEQRERDQDTFSRSDTVIGSLGGSERGLAEARRYLAYVQEGFPHYRALFVLDERGAPRVWVGRSRASGDAAGGSVPRRADAGRRCTVDGERVQFVSTPLADPAAHGSPHAMIGVDVVSG